VLLTGARGTGKSSIVKGLLNKYARQSLRLIEVEKNDLIDLPQIVDQVAGRRERFLLSAMTSRSTAPRTAISPSRWRSTARSPPPRRTC